MNINRAHLQKKRPRLLVFIGLISVTPRLDNEILGGARGAYVNVLALANSFEDYKSKISVACNELGFDVKEISDVEPFDERAQRFILDEDLKKLELEVKETRNIRFGTFHVYNQ